MDLKRKYAQLFEGKHRSNDRLLLKEADMTGKYDGFIITDRKKKTEYKFKYVKGRYNLYVENDALAAMVKKNGGKRADYSVDYFIKKGEWNQSRAKILETIVREANKIPASEDIIADGMAQVNGVIEQLYDLEQSVMSSIEMYQEETGDLRFEQILNQGARYIQAAERNLEYLHKMLKRNL